MKASSKESDKVTYKWKDILWSISWKLPDVLNIDFWTVTHCIKFININLVLYIVAVHI